MTIRNAIAARLRREPMLGPASAKISAPLLLSLLVCLALFLSTASRAAETVTYYYTNSQGTVLATTDASGSVLTTNDYRPYGGQASGSPQDGPGYTGHVNDQVSGLIYMQARYYDPDLGRFLSVDPAVAPPGDVFASRYAYADNDPIGNIDPDGRQSCVSSGCTVGPTPYSFFRDNAVGRVIGQTVGDPIALARDNNINPITSEALDKGQIAEAKLGILTLAVPASRGEALAAGVAKESVLVIRGFTAHAVDQAIERSVKPSAIMDALRNPLKITETKIDSQGRSSFNAIGSKATVTINPETGKIVTVRATSSKLAEKLSKGE